MHKLTMLIVILLAGVLVGGIHLGLAQGSTLVNGIITEDTTWAQASSPYDLAGIVAVNQGVTLTIEAGVTVNLGYYYVQVNGTLAAKGTSTNYIQFNGGGTTDGITFTSLSNGWNEQTGSGSIIQYAIIKPTLKLSSVKLDHSVILGRLSVEGSSIVTNNNITGGASVSGSAILSNNVISGILSSPPVASMPVLSVNSGLSSNELPTISNNLILGGYTDSQGTSNIGIQSTGYAYVFNNTITNCEEAIRIFSSDKTSGFPLIAKNIIVNNQAGIVIRSSDSNQPPATNSPFIKENLISNNTAGISIENHGGSVAPAILNNNIYQNSRNLDCGVPINIDATNNWWGTTNATIISQTIHDKKNDFNLGTVTFVPFLNTPNPEAPAIPASSPIPTSNTSSSPSQNPTATPNQSDSNNSVFFSLDWAEIAIIALLGFIAVLLVLIYSRRKKA